QNNIIKLLLVITVASGFVLASLESFWPPHFSGLFGGSEQNTFWFGVILGGSFLAGVFGNMLVTPISNAMGKRYALVAGTFEGIRGIVIIGLALQTNLPIAVLLFWIVYLNMGITSSPYSTLLNDQIPSSQRSSILSIASLAFYLGGAIGGILLGFIAEQLSVGVAWVISGAILVIPFILYLRIEMIQKKGDMESDDKENDEDNENKEDRLLEPG
ncbi:MAG: DHA1 family quinolone resistance protein-like MFS transporter, partial [Candidatus Promineifilaceae bacterium]